MRQRPSGPHGTIKLLFGLTATALISFIIIVSPLSTPLACAVFGLVAVLFIVGSARFRRSGKAVEQAGNQTGDLDDRISDPVLINDTWLLRR